MRDSLSDITKRDGTKLTRRRVMKLATGAGLSAPVAANMTASDVKAADSDQVTIAIDIGGNTKERVDSDWLEWHQMARKANRSIKSRHFGKDGIKWIGRTGVRKNLNPHIRVAIDEDHPQAGERRGEIPEEKKNGVEVVVQEYNDDGGDQTCTTDCWPESEGKFPGGQDCDVVDQFCTNSPRMLEDGFNWVGWTTAAHCFNDDCAAQGDVVNHAPDGQSDCIYQFGEGDGLDTSRDIAFISRANSQVTSDQNRSPQAPHPGYTILDTVSLEGLEKIYETYRNQQATKMYGGGSCYREMGVLTWDTDMSGQSVCGDSQRDQIRYWEDNMNHVQNGDSGALTFAEYPDGSGDYYALGSISGWECCDRNLSPFNYGPQGYTIYDLYDRRWR